MSKDIVWSVECIECNQTYKYKDNNNVEIQKPEVVKKTDVTSGICPRCLEIALQPLIGLA